MDWTASWDYRLEWRDCGFGLNEAHLLLTWSLWGLFSWRVLALGLDGRRVEDTGGGAVLAEMLFEAFDGAIELVGADLEVDVHEVCRKRRAKLDNLSSFSTPPAHFKAILMIYITPALVVR